MPSEVIRAVMDHQTKRKHQTDMSYSFLYLFLRDAATAVSTHATLSNCSSSVESDCKVPSGTFNSTELASCETSFAAVKAKNKKCYKATTAGEISRFE